MITEEKHKKRALKYLKELRKQIKNDDVSIKSISSENCFRELQQEHRVITKEPTGDFIITLNIKRETK